MIVKTAEKINSFLYKYGEVEQEDFEVYQYGTEIILSSALGMTLIMLISVVMSDVLAGAVFLLCFVPLRQYTGGYHAESYFKCNLIFCLSYFGLLMLANFLAPHMNPVISGIALVLFGIVVARFSPVSNKHKPLSDEKKKKCGKIAIAIYSASSVISLLLFAVSQHYSVVLTLTLALIGVMIIAEVFLQKHGFHESG